MDDYEMYLDVGKNNFDNGFASGRESMKSEIISMIKKAAKRCPDRDSIAASVCEEIIKKIERIEI